MNESKKTHKIRRGAIALAFAGVLVATMTSAPAFAATPSTPSPTVTTTVIHEATGDVTQTITTNGPLSVITTSKYCTSTCSFTETHTNSNNVTIGWNGGNSAGKAITLTKGSYYCATPVSTAASYSKVCTGVPTGTITLQGDLNSGGHATFYDRYSI